MSYGPLVTTVFWVAGCSVGFSSYTLGEVTQLGQNLGRAQMV